MPGQIAFTGPAFYSGSIELTEVYDDFGDLVNCLQLGVSGLGVGLTLGPFGRAVVDSNVPFSCQNLPGLSTSSHGLTFTGGILTGQNLGPGVAIEPGVEYV